MQYLTLAALAATFSAVAQAGVAAVHNKCSVPMYLWSVGDQSTKQVDLPDATVMYNETYRGRGAGGISIKISSTPELTDNQTQFEYTLDGATVWYDLSNINGNALTGLDYILQSTDPSCPKVTCASNDAQCKAVYNNPDDNLSTHACSADADLTFTLCPADPGKTSDDGSPMNLVGGGSGGALSEASATPAGGAVDKLATSGGDSGVTKYINLDQVLQKRDEPAQQAAHAHQHAHAHSHERLRRSRVFHAEPQQE